MAKRILEKLNNSFMYFDSINKTDAMKLWDLCEKAEGVTYIGFNTPFSTIGARGIDNAFIDNCIKVLGSKNAMHRAMQDAFRAYFLNGVKVILATDDTDFEGVVTKNVNCTNTQWSLVKNSKHGKPFIIAHGLVSTGSTE